ncbi:MAG: sigma-70 family RNA polymerase sigma factor [Clostridia bacterium]|nr:sigma-70 family RNA polymerase sigma factor [Clostridia bacterium]
MRQLSAKEQLLFHHAFREERSFSELARLYGCTEDAVRKRVTRLQEKIAKRIRKIF